MKRFFALVALVLGLASCQTEPEGLDVQMGGAVDATITVNIPDSETRAGGTNSAGSAFKNGIIDNADYTVRYILQVFNKDGSASKDIMYKYSDNDTVAFDVRLVPGRDYRFVVWADIVNATGVKDGVKCADLHYVIHETLQNITLAEPEDGDDKWAAMDETRDAYTGIYDSVEFSATENITLTLKRPFAKLRVITTDMKQLNDLDIKPTKATVEYTVDHYNAFNAYAGKVIGDSKNRNIKHENFDIKAYDDNVDGKSKVLFTDYFFAADEEEVVNFTLAVYDQNGVIIGKTINFNTPIPACRNHLTTISGNILTDGNKVNVTVEDAFENVDDNGNTTNPDYDYETISSVAELLTAINANSGEYIVTTDLDVNEVTASTQAATRTTGTGTTINLNGYTITLKTNITIAEGKTLTITDINETGETGDIINAGGKIVNNGILNIEGGSFGENTIENNETEGGKVNITGGTFKSDPSEFVDSDYNVVEKDGNYELEIKDVIAKIGEAEYRTLQKAFDAVDNGTIQLIGDVTLKETATLAEGKTATLDLNGKTLAHTDEANQYALSNLGTLTITGNGTVNSRGIYNGYGNGATVASAKLTIENGTFNAKGENGGAAVFNYGTANINGGSFTSIGGYSLNNQNGSSMIIADGVNANNGVYTSDATLTINGGEISGNRSGCHVIYCWNANITINGGTFYNNNSNNSTVMAAGTTTITYNGGTYGIKDGRVPGNGNTWTSCLLDSQHSAEVVINDGTYNGGFRVQAGTSMTINGGSFNDCYGSAYNIYGTATVKGGTYTDATAIEFAKKYVAEGYEAIEDNGVWNVRVIPVAKIGETEYETLEAAVDAAEANDTITLTRDITLSAEVTLPAGITLNGNGKQINGTIIAGGDLTFVGHTKVTLFNASSDNTITIYEGACLEVTGAGRVTLGYGNTFNITGSVENAKTADKATIQPSLIIPAGISITGGNDATMNVTNAYVKIGSTTSKPGVANGTFTLNFNNAIAEFTKEFGFYDPTGGVNPTFVMNIEDSVFTTGTKLYVTANSTVTVDNSNVPLGTNFHNAGVLNLNNGSVMTGSTIQFGENGGNIGAINVDASTFTITASGNSAGHAFDGKGIGSINATNGAIVNVNLYKDMTINVDATSTFTGVDVDANKKIYYVNSEMALEPTNPDALGGAVVVSNVWDKTTGKGVITFDRDLTTIGEKAFQRVTNDTPSNWATSITLPNSVKTIGNYAFAQCYSLTNIVIPDGVTSIGQYAFQSCEAVTTVTIGSGVTTIGSGAFYNCYEIKEIICKSTTAPALADKWVFNGVEKTATVYVPTAYVDTYKAADIWKDFNIMGR